MIKPDPSHFFDYLHNHLRLPIHQRKSESGFELYDIDLTSWRLSLPSKTHIVRVTQEQLESMEPRDLMFSLRSVIYNRSWNSDPAVFVVTDDDGQTLKQYRESDDNLVYIGINEINTVMQSNKPLVDLKKIVVSQAQISTLLPYETTAPVTGSQFFGREREIKDIVANRKTNYLITGIRRIGKTSLMRETQRRIIGTLPDERHRHILYMDCSTITAGEKLIEEVISRMDPRGLTRLERQYDPYTFFERWFSQIHQQMGTPPVLMLDEIDNLIAQQRAAGDQLLHTLRAAYMQGDARYIIAGFSQILQTAYNYHSALRDLFELKIMGPLSKGQARDMVIIPFSNVGVSFEDEETIAHHIYTRTGGQPLLMQHYCRILAEILQDNDGSTITLPMVRQVTSDHRLINALVNTFMDNTSGFEKACVFAVTLYLKGNNQAKFTLEVVISALQAHYFQATIEQVERACHALEMVGIISWEDRSLAFVIPLLPEMLSRRYNLASWLGRLKKEVG